MSEGASADRLVTTRQFVVVLRLVLQAGDNLSGELLGPRGADRYRFVGINRLPETVLRWLGDAQRGFEHGGNDPKPPN